MAKKRRAHDQEAWRNAKREKPLPYARNNVVDVLQQPRQLGREHVPQDVHVYAEVVVHELVPHAGDGLPLDFGMCACQGGRKMFRRLPEDLDVANHGVLRLGIGEKCP